MGYFGVNAADSRVHPVELTSVAKRKLKLAIPGGYLRPLVPEDVHAAYVHGLNDPEVNKYMVSVRAQTQTLETVRAFVQANHIAPQAVLFGLWMDGEGRHCGTVRLHEINAVECTAVLGICIFDKRAWGRALGSTAIDAVTQWAFRELGLASVEAGTYLDNAASWKAFLKAGYSVLEDISGRYERDGLPVVVRVLIARQPRRP